MPKKTERILRGIITLYILRLLIDQPRHGYELEKLINEKLEYRLPEGSIYIILKYMIQKQLISAETIKNNKGQLVKKYHITEKGKEFFINHEKPLMAVRKVIDELLQVISQIKYH
ncbi:MAG: PadR family transcriptional regulator [Saccharolobus sp.]|jgi:DNA-binding PadR family transcriptional regulator